MKSSNFIFAFAALTAIAVATSTFAASGLSWGSTSIDMFGDDIAVAVHPDGAFLATDGFDIERSVDSGVTWKTVTGFAAFAGGAFGIDPTDPALVYAGRSHGMMKSVDGGASWFELTDINAGGQARAIVVAPSEPATIYVGTPHGWGVYKSPNRGGTWTNILSSRDVTSLVVDPQNSHAVVAGTVAYYEKSGGILQTRDGGANWTIRLSSVNILALAQAPTSGEIIYAGSESHGIHRSVNGGQDWVAIPSTAGLGPVSALAVHPTNSTTIFAGVKAAGIFVSHDAGETWNAQNAGLADLNVVALATRITAPFTLLAATYAGRVFWANPPATVIPPTPPLIAVRRYAGISVQGQIGRTYQIQYRTNVATGGWMTLGQVQLDTNPKLLIDETPADTEARFYQAVALP
jgi:photosystem II stability/assembly factor-like uncharacterized protein